MERSAAYKWAGHVVPGSWLDWEDHMAHAGEEGDGAGVGVGERGAGVGCGRERSKAEGAGAGGGGYNDEFEWIHYLDGKKQYKTALTHIQELSKFQ